MPCGIGFEDPMAANDGLISAAHRVKGDLVIRCDPGKHPSLLGKGLDQRGEIRLAGEGKEGEDHGRLLERGILFQPASNRGGMVRAFTRLQPPDTGEELPADLAFVHR